MSWNWWVGVIIIYCVPFPSIYFPTLNSRNVNLLLSRFYLPYLLPYLSFYCLFFIYFPWFISSCFILLIYSLYLPVFSLVFSCALYDFSPPFFHLFYCLNLLCSLHSSILLSSNLFLSSYHYFLHFFPTMALLSEFPVLLILDFSSI